jgi:hypothetical protein
MNYQKDIKNTDSNSYGHSNVQSPKLFINKDIFEYSYKKTEKLATALYMVTDCMEVDDALKGKIRHLSIELLSYIHKLTSINSKPIDNQSYIANSVLNIDEIISLISIANTMGFISDMNTSILKNELTTLENDLKENQAKKDNFGFTLDEKMFSLPRPTETFENKEKAFIKDKRTDYNMSFRLSNNMSLIKKPSNLNINPDNKKDRVDKILSIIKAKDNQSNSELGISIKDILLLSLKDIL